MLWISFDRWSSSAGDYLIATRIYWRGYRWTPFVRLRWRY